MARTKKKSTTSKRTNNIENYAIKKTKQTSIIKNKTVITENDSNEHKNNIKENNNNEDNNERNRTPKTSEEPRAKINKKSMPDKISKTNKLSKNKGKLKTNNKPKTIKKVITNQKPRTNKKSRTEIINSNLEESSSSSIIDKKEKNNNKAKKQNLKKEFISREETITKEDAKEFETNSLLSVNKINCESFIVSDISFKENDITEKNDDASNLNQANDKDDTIISNNEFITKKSPIVIIDTSDPKSIYKDFSELNLSIKDFIFELPSLHQKQLKKLCIITMNKKICIKDLQDLTTNKDRNVRFLSTNCLLHKIRTSLTVKSKIDYTDILYEIIESRTRDIDSNIRASCYEHLLEIYKYIDIRIKFINNGLDDKSDIVRKKILKGLILIIDKKNIVSIKNKIINLCRYEKNLSNKKEACKCLLAMYSHKIIVSEEIFDVLDNFSEKEMQGLYEHLRNERDTVDILKDLNNIALKKLTLNDEDMKIIIDKVQEDTKYLQIISLVIKKQNNIVKDLILFLEIYRENTENINFIFVALNIIDDKYFTAEYENIIDLCYNILINYDDEKLYDNIFKLYQKLENVYSKVNIVLEKIRYGENDKFLLYILKYFDFSDLLNDRHCFEAKILSCFWWITKETYGRLKEISLKITDDSDFKVASNYILHLNNIIKDKIDTNEIYDNITALNYLYKILCENATHYLNIPNIEIADSYIKICHLLPIHKYLFTCKRKQIITYLNNTKIIDDNFIDLFFNEIMDTKKYTLGDIKIICMSLLKKIKKCNIFGWLLRLKNYEKLYDNCFVYFVKYLEVYEAIKLIKFVKINCKYKNALLMKCKNKLNGLKDEINSNDEINMNENKENQIDYNDAYNKDINYEENKENKMQDRKDDGLSEEMEIVHL